MSEDNNPFSPPAAAENTVMNREEEIEKGKMIALISHLGPVFGLPIFILPFVMDKNEFALVHAKYAAANFIASILAFMVISVFVTVTCGLGFPLYFLLFAFYIPMIQGLIAANNGTTDEPLVAGALAKMIFGEDMDPFA